VRHRLGLLLPVSGESRKPESGYVRTTHVCKEVTLWLG
jgi:hypothetical protein